MIEADLKIEVPNVVGKYPYKVKATADGGTELITKEKTIEVKCGLKSSQVIEDPEFETSINIQNTGTEVQHEFKAFSSSNS